MIVGERVAELLGPGLADLSADRRLIALECHPLDISAADVCIGPHVVAYIEALGFADLVR